MDYAKESLRLHGEWKGKIEVITTVPVSTKDDLSLAYTPGVAQPCLEIQKDINKSYELTRRHNMCAVITDGRFSGGTSGLSVGYVSPEAALGGPLGLIEEGDIIEIDVAKRSMNVELSDEELAERKANFHWEFPADKYPRFLRLFVKNVGSMAKGGIWE